jgi:integrase
MYFLFIQQDKQRKAVKVGPSKKEAIKKLKDAKKLLDSGKFKFVDDPAPELAPTFAEYFETFKRAHLGVGNKNPDRRATTIRFYESSFKNYLSPVFGNMRLDEIQFSHVEDFITQLKNRKPANGNGDTLARDTIRLPIAALRKIMNHAIRRGIIQRNPAAGIGDLISNTKRRHERVEYLSESTAEIFLNSAKTNAPEYFTLFLAGLHTGAREGELRGMKWSDLGTTKEVDPKTGKERLVPVVTIERSIDEKRNINPTKTNSVRSVPLSDTLLAELRILKEHRIQEWKGKRKDEIPEWIFCNREGGILDTHNVKTRHFKKCLQLAKLKAIKFHSLRHSFGSILIQKGVPLINVSRWLGHTSLKITADIYAHLEPHSNSAALNMLPSIGASAPVSNVITWEKTGEAKA